MNRSGSGTRITKNVRSVIYEVWKSYQDKLSKTPGQKFSIKKLLDDVNTAIRSRNLRMDIISKSQLYVEIKKFRENTKQIDPSLDRPFDLGIFVREYGNRADAEAVKYIFAVLKAYEVDYENKERMHVITNRQALWIAKLYKLIIDSNLIEDDVPIDDIDENSPKVKGDIWALFNVSHTYAMFEQMFDTIGEPFNSQKLDYGLAKGDWDEWNSASMAFLFHDLDLMKKVAGKLNERQVNK